MCAQTTVEVEPVSTTEAVLPDEQTADEVTITVPNTNVAGSIAEPFMPSGSPPVTTESPKKRRLKKSIQRYYDKQTDMVTNLKSDEELVRKFEQKLNNPYGFAGAIKPGSTEDIDDHITGDKLVKRDAFLAKLSFCVNLSLLVIKIAAAVLSGSMSVISSAVDSGVDLTSGLVIYLCNRKIKRRNPYKFPRGRTRLEPLAIIIVSVVMGIASFQVIVESGQALANHNFKPDVGLVTVIIMCITIVAKLALLIICCVLTSPNAKVLAQDHRNDCISNSVAIVCAYIGDRYWRYIDPICAIAVSIYICISWYITGVRHASILSGRGASPSFIGRILAICINHDDRILFIDTIHAYHYGTNFMVELDVVMDQSLTVKESHDITEPLQQKIECLPFVERCFLHIDYEYDHRPDHEHKVV